MKKPAQALFIDVTAAFDHVDRNLPLHQVRN